MLDRPLVNLLCHVKPGDRPWNGAGLRGSFLSRDRGVVEATGGRVVAALVTANQPPQDGTGRHRHGVDFHIVIMLQGWARFIYEAEEHRLAAGDCVHQRPGITHDLFACSPDREYPEIAAPADFKTAEVAAPCAGPAPWKWTDAADAGRSLSAR